MISDDDEYMDSDYEDEADMEEDAIYEDGTVESGRVGDMAMYQAHDPRDPVILATSNEPSYLQLMDYYSQISDMSLKSLVEHGVLIDQERTYPFGPNLNDMKELHGRLGSSQLTYLSMHEERKERTESRSGRPLRTPGTLHSGATYTEPKSTKTFPIVSYDLPFLFRGTTNASEELWQFERDVEHNRMAIYHQTGEPLRFHAMYTTWNVTIAERFRANVQTPLDGDNAVIVYQVTSRPLDLLFLESAADGKDFRPANVPMITHENVHMTRDDLKYEADNITPIVGLDGWVQVGGSEDEVLFFQPEHNLEPKYIFNRISATPGDTGQALFFDLQRGGMSRWLPFLPNNGNEYNAMGAPQPFTRKAMEDSCWYIVGYVFLQLCYLFDGQILPANGDWNALLDTIQIKKLPRILREEFLNWASTRTEPTQYPYILIQEDGAAVVCTETGSELVANAPRLQPYLPEQMSLGIVYEMPVEMHVFATDLLTTCINIHNVLLPHGTSQEEIDNAFFATLFGGIWENIGLDLYAPFGSWDPLL